MQRFSSSAGESFPAECCLQLALTSGMEAATLSRTMKPIANMWLRKKMAAKDSAENTHEIDPSKVGSFSLGKPLEPASKKAEDEITVTLGDFLPRIEVRFLKHAEHDQNREVRFKISEISEMIAQQKTKVPIARIAAACPDIFRDEKQDFQGLEIYFPWRKLAERLEKLRPAGGRDGKDGDAFDKPATVGRPAFKHTRPISAFTGKKAAQPSSPPAQPVANIQTGDLLRRQRDLAVQQRDQALAKLKAFEEQTQREITILTAERDQAIAEKVDALAFIALASKPGESDPPK